MWPPNQNPYPNHPPVAAPPGHVPPPAPPTDDDGEDDDVLATLRKRLIQFDTLDRPMRALLLVAFAQLGVVALLLGTRDLPQIEISAGGSANLQANQVPLVSFVVTAVSLGLGFVCALSGALLVRTRLRLFIVALVTVVLGVEPIVGLFIGSGLSGTTFDAVAVLWWFQIAALLAIWGWTIKTLRPSPEPVVFMAPAHRHTFPRRTFIVMLALILAYYAAEFAVWIAYARAGIRFGPGLFANSITFQLENLPLLLAAIIFWSSTDFLEWGDLAARTLFRWVGTLSKTKTSAPLPLLILTGVVALAMTVDVLRPGDNLLVSLIGVALIIGLTVVVARAANIDGTWPSNIPVSGQILGPAFLFTSLGLALPAGLLLAAIAGLPTDLVYPLAISIGVMVDLVALTAGLVLALRGRSLHRRREGAIGLYLVTVALVTIAGSLTTILGVSGLPGSDLPLHILAGLKLLAALAVLGTVVWLGANRHRVQDAAGLLRIGFLLLAGLQTASWFFNISDGINALGALSPMLFALLFLLAVLWDLLTSGEQVTNSGSAAYPRMGRLLIYVGYTLVSSAILLFSATVQFAPGSSATADQFTPDTDVQLGLSLLGIPSVLCIAALRLWRWPAERRLPAFLAQRTTLADASATTQRVIVGAGALAIIAISIITAVSVVPRALVAVNAQALTVYRAATPGPGCDKGTAQWALVPGAGTITCLPSGMRLSVAADRDAIVEFHPPGSIYPANYSVAVRADMSAMRDGCAEILTRDEGTGFYILGICTDGAWHIFRYNIDTGKADILKAGKVQPARSYSLTATVNGSRQTLAIDGIAVGQTTDSTLQGGEAELLVSNAGTQTGSVVFSDFVFAPLS